jgi:flagellar protein FliS
MIATASRSNVSQRQAGVYQQVHVSSGVMGASPHGLIGMLFDGLLGALAEARGAIRSRNVAAKGKAIGRAVRIVDEGLSAALDLEQGGALAADLRALYSYVALRLTQANLHNDEAALEECVRLFEPLRCGWAAIADNAGA